MSEIHIPCGYKKRRSEVFEDGIKSVYGKKVTCFAENRVSDGGQLSRAIRWFKANGKEIVLDEHYLGGDTDFVEVKFGGTIKRFYQGSWDKGLPGKREDYCGANAYVEAERYAMEKM